MGTATTTTRSKPARRFLLCFKSKVADDDAEASTAVTKPQYCRGKDGGGNVLTYIAVHGDKEGVVFPNVLNPTKESVSRTRKEGSNRFTKIIRSIVFETALAKKMRKRKKKQKSFGLAMSQYKEKFAESESAVVGIRGRTSMTETVTGSSSSSTNIGSASSMSVSMVSSCRSSPARNRMPPSKPIHPNPTGKNQNIEGGGFTTTYTIIGLFLLCFLLSFIIIIICACTSACLFVVPQLSRSRTMISMSPLQMPRI